MAETQLHPETQLSPAAQPGSAIQLDPAILGVLPPGSNVLSIKQHGLSAWASTSRVETQQADGSRKSYFLKTLKASDAAERVLGEFMSMSEIYKTLPSIAPEPIGYGKCSDPNTPDTYYFICEYLRIIQKKLPDPVLLGETLAKLHRTSESPTGKFGFHCTTFDGKLPLNTTWDASWTSFFTTLIRDVYNLDTEVNGFWAELDDAMEVTTTKLIPRLLNTLVADGRTIKPTLIHGDLWESNIGTDARDGRIYIYDAAAYYAHHEKEAGIWRCQHHKLHNEVYRDEYFKHFEPSEPKNEADDRNRLYSVETLLINSAHFPGAETRRIALNELNWLINRYKDEM